MPKPKPVNWQIIEEQELYNFVAELLEKYHRGKESIEEVNYVLMWRHNVKMDQDGYVLLASITKSSDQNRELRPHDVIIGINKDAWSILEDHHKAAVIDAQLERIAVCTDKDDNPKEDDRSRTIFRLRRQEVLDEHTLQRRHGITMQEVQEFVYNKFKNAGAEEGSYIAKAMNNDEDEPSTNQSNDEEFDLNIPDDED